MTPEERKKQARKETKARLKASGAADRPIYSDATINDIIDADESAAGVVTPTPGAPITNSPTPNAPVSGIGSTESMRERQEELALNSVEGPKRSMPVQREEEPEGVLGTVMDLADKVWHDDMGGVLRGDAGFTQHIPGYEYTLGVLADGALSMGSNVVETLYWGSEQSDHALAWLYSAMPGGMETLDVEWGGFKPVGEGGGMQGEVAEISAGRAGYAAMASPIAEWADGNPELVKRLGGFMTSLNPILGPPALILGGVALHDSDNPIFTKEGQENILDSDVQKSIYDDNTALGVIGAGSADFVWDIFGDPTIVGGKISSVVRYGTKGGRFQGIANQGLHTAKQVKKFGQRIDEGLVRQTEGAKRTTAEFEHVKSLVDNEPALLTDHVFVKNSNDPAAVMRLASEVKPGDYATGAALVKALAGETSGWVQLSKLSPGLYDDLYRTVTGGADLFDDAARGAALTDTQVVKGRQMVSEAQDALDDVAKRVADDNVRAASIDIRASFGDDFGGAYKTVAAGQGDQVVLGGKPVDVVARHTPDANANALVPDFDLVDFVEIKDADSFAAMINGAKEGNKYGAAVTAYTPAEYAGARLFVTADGTAGFALKGDDIVSAFKGPGSKAEGFSMSAMLLGIKNGGRRADAFDTVLPDLYTRVGMRPVARVAFDDDYAPVGWDYKTFEKFNNGRPDVVFFAYDPKYVGKYDSASVPLASSYDEGLEIQAKAVKAIESGADVAAAGQILTRGGGRVASMAQGADAWRMGKARGRWGSASIQQSENQGWLVKRIQATSTSRPMMFIRWGGRGRPTNIVHLKGGDGVNANTEVHAWLTHSSIDVADRTKFFNAYIKETTVEGRRNLLLAMERAEVKAVAKKLGMGDTQEGIDAAYAAYQSYHSMRNRKVWEVRKTAQEMAEQKQGSAFTIDEQGNMVHVAGLYSELDEAFPLLDTLEFTRVVKANKGMLLAKAKNYTLQRGTEIGDVLNNMWKVSVLLRLGYTARNITEGALRSVATVGVLAAHPQALARVPSSLRYRAAMKAAHGKKGKLTVKANAVDDAMKQMNDALKALDDFKVANGIDARAAAQSKLDDLNELLKIQREQVSKATQAATREQVAASRLPIDDEIDDISRVIDDLKKRFEVAEIKAAGGGGKAAMHDIQKEINSATRRLETRVKNREKAVEKALAQKKKDVAAAERILAKRQAAVDKQAAIVADKDAKFVEAQPGLKQAEQLIESKRANVETRLKELRQVKANLDKKRPKRARVGESENKVGVTAQGEDIMYEGAFMGSDGDIARILASADNTYSQVFNTGYQTRAKQIKYAQQWKKVDPADIRTAEGWAQYWDDFALKLNRTYRNDPIMSRWLARGDDEAGLLLDTEKWLMRSDNRSLAGTLRTQDGKRLVDGNGNAIRERVQTYVNETYTRFTREVPKGTGVRQALSEGQITPEDLRVMFGTKQPPVLTAPVEEGVAGFTKAFDKYQSVTGWAMKWLGTIPENQLLRHPFYEAVFRAEQMRLARLASENGADLLAKATKAQINGAARRVALKETRKTMYTIERQTNASNVLRFVMPFFPAWENALRTWGRIAYRNPAVIGAGALLWNVPNSLGWVVDDKGNKVEFSNFLSETQETYMVYPPAVGQALSNLNRDVGPFNTTMLMPFVGNFIPPQDADGKVMTTKTRQQGLNVLFPGGLLDPGIGPMSTIPTSLFLRGKPELTEILRQNLGDDMFGNIVPMGNPNTPIADQFLPTIVKRTKQYLFGGEDENTAYLRLKNTMITDEIVRANLTGRKVTEKDMERVLKDADSFWQWSIQQAAMGFTASLNYQSEFAVEQGIWKSLLDRTDLTYQQKLDEFIRKTGGIEYLPLTRSSSKNQFKLRYTQRAYERATKDPGRIEDIAELGSEYVGQFANIGDIADPFSYSVYGEYAGMRIDDDRVLEKMTPEEIIEANDTAEYWRNRALAKDGLDAQAIAIGLPGADSLDGYSDIMDVIEADLLKQYPGAQKALDKGYDVNQINKRIKVARMTVETAEEYGDENNPTIEVLNQYLAMRRDIVRALGSTDDADAKKEIRKIAMAEVAALRAKDIGFADYFDRYLEDDDFRKVE